MSNQYKSSPDNNLLFYIGNETIPELLDFLKERQINNIVLVSDDNEYRALGARVEKALRDANYSVKDIILSGDEIGADEKYIVQVLLPADDSEQLFISVGSGTVTDIVRFVSYRAKSPFISLPTAPSVDGFASNGSSMTIMGFKQTIISRPPLAIFADLDTLCNAPKPLIAAGFGDMFGKFTALADWKLAKILNGDSYDDVIAERSRIARDSVVSQVPRLNEDWDKSIKSVMEALHEEGLCMLEYGSSRPASGSEHSFSHYWEMMLLNEGRPAVFHGSKVGLASIWIAKYYEILRNMTKEEAGRRLDNTQKFDADMELQKMNRGYNSQVAPHIIKSQEAHLNMKPETYENLKQNITDKWDEVQKVAREVPSPDELRQLLINVGGATEPPELGLTSEDIRKAIEYAQYVRKTFTILNVSQMLGFRPEV